MEEALLQKMENRKEPEYGKHSGSRRPEDTGSLQLSKIDLPASIREGGLRIKRYRRRQHTAILFVVDASRSQGAKERLAFAKGAVMAILKEAYTRREKVGMLLFGDRRAEVVLPYTKSVDFAADRMKEVKAKGNTPLAMGIRLAIQTWEQERRKYPEELQIIVLLTDGKSNYDVQEGKPLKLTMQAAKELQKREIPLLVIDTENTVFGMGLAGKIADTAHGEYVTLT